MLIKRLHLSLVLYKVVVTQPQAEVLPLQFRWDQRVELQRWPETRTFLASELNLQTFHTVGADVYTVYAVTSCTLHLSHRSQMTRTYHTSATSVALASSPSTSAVQTRLYHVQLSVWSGASVLGGWCPASCWQRSASPSISQHGTCIVPRTQNSFNDRLFCCRT